MNKFLTAIGATVFVVAVLVILGAAMAWPVQLLWNGLLQDIFGLKTISFLQAWGLLILSGMLFKSSVSSKS
jgi:uncharacterized membrane protein YkgB